MGSQVEGGVVPTLAHKFFETDLPFGLCTFKDIANMLKVEVPLIDAMIRWNQKLIGKVYLADDGTVTGEHASECILPSTFGLTQPPSPTATARRRREPGKVTVEQ